MPPLESNSLIFGSAVWATYPFIKILATPWIVNPGWWINAKTIAVAEPVSSVGMAGIFLIAPPNKTSNGISVHGEIQKPAFIFWIISVIA